MLLGLEVELWKLLLALVLVPLAAIALLNLALRRRGGVAMVWGGVIFVLMAALVAVLVILDKVRL
ncbi:hypothetical protein [Luteimonas saliphila]|uniref:hypothetical protein n=1 Tax=Luteimonas saliphila TaxID=2804919 RepID=UPI00192D4A19|nr:hypothetical protein [Luteimonas saliphila]